MREIILRIARHLEGIYYEDMHGAEQKICNLLVENGYAKWIGIDKKLPGLKRLKAVK